MRHACAQHTYPTHAGTGRSVGGIGATGAGQGPTEQVGGLAIRGSALPKVPRRNVGSAGELYGTEYISHSNHAQVQKKGTALYLLTVPTLLYCTVPALITKLRELCAPARKLPDYSLKDSKHAERSC